MEKRGRTWWGGKKVAGALRQMILSIVRKDIGRKERTKWLKIDKTGKKTRV